MMKDPVKRNFVDKGLHTQLLSATRVWLLNSYFAKLRCCYYLQALLGPAWFFFRIPDFHTYSWTNLVRCGRWKFSICNKCGLCSNILKLMFLMQMMSGISVRKSCWTTAISCATYWYWAIIWFSIKLSWHQIGIIVIRQQWNFDHKTSTMIRQWKYCFGSFESSYFLPQESTDYPHFYDFPFEHHQLLFKCVILIFWSVESDKDNGPFTMKRLKYLIK